MTGLISTEVETRFAIATLMRAEVVPITGQLGPPGVASDYRFRPFARRALLAQEYFEEYGPWNAPPLPTNEDEMRELGKRDDFGLAVASFAHSLELNGWDIDRHPRYQEYMAGLLSLPRLWLAYGTFREPEKLCRYYGAYPLRGLHGNGIWQPGH